MHNNLQSVFYCGIKVLHKHNHAFYNLLYCLLLLRPSSVSYNYHSQHLITLYKFYFLIRFMLNSLNAQKRYVFAWLRQPKYILCTHKCLRPSQNGIIICYNCCKNFLYLTFNYTMIHVVNFKIRFKLIMVTIIHATIMWQMSNHKIIPMAFKLFKVLIVIINHNVGIQLFNY